MQEYKINEQQLQALGAYLSTTKSDLPFSNGIAIFRMLETLPLIDSLDPPVAEEQKPE